MTRYQSAFTLIELMIVVAIIGILASMALPAYQQFVVRSQISEGFSLSTPLKTATVAFYQDRGHWPSDIAQLGLSEPASGKYVSSVVVLDGVLNITYEGASGGNGYQANDIINGQVLSLRPALSQNGDVVWICGHRAVPSGATPVGTNSTTFNTLTRYLPAICKS